MKTKRREGPAASKSQSRAPRFPKSRPWYRGASRPHPSPARAWAPACQSRQPPSADLRQVRILDDKLDILVGELRDPHGGLIGVRHHGPPSGWPPASAPVPAAAPEVARHGPRRFREDAPTAPPAARRLGLLLARRFLPTTWFKRISFNHLGRLFRKTRIHP